MNPQGSSPEAPDSPVLSMTEARLRALVEQFSDALRRGEAPDLFDWLLAYPDLAAELEPRLAQVQQLYEQARPAWSSLAREPAPPPTDLPGWVGRYRIDGLLGQGNQAVVFRAYDPKFDRPVALKVLHPSLAATEGYLQRFHLAAKVVARLRHPHIVELHDAGQEAGFHYIDMFLVEGETLQQHLERLRGARLPYRTAAELIFKLAQALHHAHTQGIVHRDVKPANVLLQTTERGSSGSDPVNRTAQPPLDCLHSAIPLLTDFGLARELTLDATQSRPGAVVGTLAYMSPEQAEGHNHATDARSDVYALGAVLYELLTGHWPFHECQAFAALMQQKLHTDAPSPRALNQEAPLELETICLKALERDPCQRFATAEAMAEELWRWLHDEPLTIRPPTGLDKARRWARRNRAAAMLTAALALAVLIAASVFAWRHAERALETQVRERLEGENAQLKDRAVKEFEKFYLLNAWQRLSVPTKGRRQDTLDMLTKEIFPKRRATNRPLFDVGIRSLIAAALAVPDVSEHQQIDFKDDPFLLLPVSMHPLGREMVIGLPAGPMRWQEGQALELADDVLAGVPQSHLRHSPDGKWLAYAPTEGGLELRSAADVIKVHATQPGAGTIRSLAFDRAGALWTVNAAGNVRQWSTPDLRAMAQWDIPEGSAAVTLAAVREDGVVAVADARGRVLLCDRTTGRPPIIPPLGAEVEALAWSHDGRLFAVGTRDGTVRFTASDGTLLRTFMLTANGVGRVVFSPDGQWLIAGQRGATMKAWDALTGDQVLTGNLVPWTFARDNWRFAGTRIGRISFAEIELPVATAFLRGHQVAVDRLVWSRDGTHLASLDARGEIRVWDVARGAEIDVIHSKPGSFYGSNSGLALSDDGRWLAYASGGRNSFLLLRNVQSRAEPKTWDLLAGYDRLVCIGGNRFRSVREEEERPMSKCWQSVVRDVDCNHGPSAPRVLRPHRPGDIGFYTSELPGDGQRYLWIGPRAPASAIRAEVWDVANNRRIFQQTIQHDQPHHVVDGHLDEKCGLLWLNRVDATARGMVYDLSGARPPQPSDPPPLPFGSRFWQVAGHDDPILEKHFYHGLTPTGQAQTWLYLPPEYGGPHFSPDGRRLASSLPNGTIIVIDLATLKARLDEFERTELARE